MFTNSADVKRDNGLPVCHECALDNRLICTQQCQGCSIVSDKIEFPPPVVVMGQLFTYEGQAVIFERSDGKSCGPITGGLELELNETYVDALAREIKEEAGLEVNESQMIMADEEFVALTPTSGRRIHIVSFGVFLAQGFAPEKSIRLNQELSGYRVMELEDAGRYLDEKALPESRKAFEIITGIDSFEGRFD